MTYPLPGRESGRSGASYAAVLVRADPLDALRRMRFSGWVAPEEGGWRVVVASAVDRPVASGRRGIAGVGASLPGTALAVRVVDDRQLLLALWSDGAPVARYDSFPDYDGTEDAFGEPDGAGHAAALASACGRPGAAEDLAELLARELDHDSVAESERLVDVLRLLGLPLWVVAVTSLPRDIPTGPRAATLTRLRAVPRRRWPTWPPPA